MPIDARTRKLLKSSDPKERRQAIVALAESRDPDALKPLAEIAQTDENPKLRDLAVRAQKHLDEQLARVQMSARADGSASPAPAARSVSEKDAARARGYMDEAMSMFMADQLGKAADCMLKALKTDPALKHDAYFKSMVGTIFDTTPDEALAMLMDQEQRGQFVSSQKRAQVQKKKNEHLSQSNVIGWGAAWFDLAIYGVVVAVITFLAPLVFRQMIAQTIAYQTGMTLEQLQQEAFALSPEMMAFTRTLEGLAIGLFLVIALINGVGSVVGMLIQGGLIHVVATRLLRGVGTLPFMLTQIVPFYSMMFGVLFVLWCIFMAALSSGAGMIGVICIGPIMALASLFILFKTVDKIGTAYDFGVVSGCLSLLIANLLLAGATSVIGLVFQTALIAALENLILTSVPI